MPAKKIEFSSADLGIASDVWVFEPATGHGTLVRSDGKFNATFADSDYKKAWSYFIVAPVTKSGIALLGDSGKIASAGNQRLPKIDETADGLTAAVSFAATEKTVSLHGFAPHPPVVTAESGTVEPVKYTAETREFSVEVSPDAGGKAVVRFSVR
jgi:hypothetical protein